MSEASTDLRGVPGIVHRRCFVCDHVHRITQGSGLLLVTWEPACACGCKVQRAIYDHGSAGINPDVHSVYDNDDNYCGSVTFPRCLPAPAYSWPLGHSDSAATVGVDPSGGLRGGWLGWVLRLALSRLARYLGDELVSEGRVESTDRSRPGDTGLADHGGGADSAGSAGPVGRVCGVVKPPQSLIDLRVAASGSWRWRKGGFSGGASLSIPEYTALPESRKRGYRWAADPKLVGELCAAELEFTRSFGQ